MINLHVLNASILLLNLFNPQNGKNLGQDMKIYWLHHKNCGWDEMNDQVIRAETESRAREIANDHARDEGKIWDDKELVTCEVLGRKGGEGLILSKFKAS